ncbi:alpha/beta hydrolase [Cerasicoccus fimbriatus]|uniref:alpha/beta hydrolase n=1 Tax=Cerasicoccus fimbriatus TaxID=3014554 RepID=UPI0022B41DC2|nr:alpha/beta hydrolase [Cerasicoccus sp. TK19100]
MRCLLLNLSIAVLFVGCASKPYQLEVMRAPAVYEGADIDRLSVERPRDVNAYEGMLYATNRMRVVDDADSREFGSQFYGGQTDGVVRVGVAKVTLTDSELDWDDVRKISTSAVRDKDLVIQIESVDELGVLSNTRHPFVKDPTPDTPDADAAFAELINRQLAQSGDNEILIFVHGYKTPFDDPVLVATEFWHFMGYDGVTIAYSWPSTPSFIAYLRDIEASGNSAREFRRFLQFLADNTNVEKINVLAYSAGTRMAAETLHNIAIDSSAPHLGHVILVSGDVSAAKVGALLADDALDKVDTFTIYNSTGDMALGFSDWLFDRNRIGGSHDALAALPEALDFVRNTPKLQLINVSDAEDATKGNGHGYFRNSPWTSSDILASLDFHLTPAERGLVWNDATGEWTFPPDYMGKLRAAIKAKIGQ